jgi:putative ABC transport system substrate-binding protein
MITRRVFVGTLAGGLLAIPLAGEAQLAGKVYRIGLLCANFCDSSAGRGHTSPMIELQAGLLNAGYVDGRNLFIDDRGAGVADSQLDAAATRLVAQKVDVIVAAGTSASVYAARRVTRSIPIVMVVSDDADQAAFAVGGLARPDENVTGMTVPLGDLVTRQVQLLTEAVRGLSSLAVVSNPNNPGHRRATIRAQETAHSLGQRVSVVSVESPTGFTNAFTEILKARPDALLILPDPLLERGAVPLFALTNRLPTMFTFAGPVATASGLMAYGPNLADFQKRAAIYIDKILKGSKPADLPIEQPTRFELTINLNTAKALGLTIPQSVLGRADDVIQ